MRSLSIKSGHKIGVGVDEGFVNQKWSQNRVGVDEGFVNQKWSKIRVGVGEGFVKQKWK